MSNIYIGLSLSLLCVILAYAIASKFVLVALFCVLLACVYFKDDLTHVHFIVTHASVVYFWFLELWSYISNMYHQSNSSSFPTRKYLENNCSLSRQQDRIHPKVKSITTHNLNSYYDNPQSSTAKISLNSTSEDPLNLTPNPVYYPCQQYSNRSNMCGRRTTDHVTNLDSSPRPLNSSTKWVMPGYPKPVLTQAVRGDDQRTKYIESLNSSNLSPITFKPRFEETPLLNAQLIANVNSPGFCGRAAERLSETMIDQPKYETVGAFPVVHLKSQSPKIKVKTPVRVRLAPSTSKDLVYTTGANSIPRPSLMGVNDSMKSVLQVLKEISRKRIHSQVDDECDESSKRLRVSESQYTGDSGTNVSLLQQTYQGKRAREDTSPNEADTKKRRKSVQSNEISSSLSSSKSVKAPHLQPQKRKAQAIEDLHNSTPVLGKLLKVQTEITPPPVQSTTPPVSTFDEVVEESPRSRVSVTPSLLEDKEPSNTGHVTVNQATVEKLEESNEDESVSRLLGRISKQTEPIVHHINDMEKNIFSSTNDLSLSPPKENRLAAMIAVLGGPDKNEDSNTAETLKSPRLDKLSKALFMSPDTPKQNKKVTFNDSLTTTKVYDRDKSEIDQKPDKTQTTTVGNFEQFSSPTISGSRIHPPSSYPVATKSKSSSVISSSTSFLNQSERVADNSNHAVSTEVSFSNVLNGPNSSEKLTSSPPITPESTGAVSNSSLAVARGIQSFESSFNTTTSKTDNSKIYFGQTLDPNSKAVANENLKIPQTALMFSVNSSSSASGRNFKEEVNAPMSAKVTGEDVISSNLFVNQVNNNRTGNVQNYGDGGRPLESSLATSLNSKNSNSSPPLHFTSTSFISTSNTSIVANPVKLSSVSKTLPLNQPNIFSNASSNNPQPHQGIFGNNINSDSSVFGDKANTFKPLSNTQTPFLFGNPDTKTTTQSNLTVTTCTTTNNNLFRNISSDTNSKHSIFGTEQNSTTNVSNKMFGSSTSFPVNSSFGTLLNNSTFPSSNGLSSSQVTSQATFGSGLPSNKSQSSAFSTNSSLEPSLLSSEGNKVSNSLFQGKSQIHSLETKSNLSNTKGFENNSNKFVFGNQPNIGSSAFGNRSSSESLGQTFNSLITTHNNITQPVGSFSSSISSTNTNVTKSTGSSLSTPFLFGSQSTSNADQAAKPFSFGSQQSGSAVENSSQFSLAQFSKPSSGFGGTVQPPSFTGNNPQSATIPAYGQDSTTPRFNTAAPQPIAGSGMFNIGSGNTGPRSKTTAHRRRLK